MSLHHIDLNLSRSQQLLVASCQLVLDCHFDRNKITAAFLIGQLFSHFPPSLEHDPQLPLIAKGLSLVQVVPLQL